MKAASLILAAALAIASTASAQTMVRPMVAPAIAQIDTAALEKQKMERENAKLREENAALKQRVDAMTSLGGSQVHAYCPAGSPGISRNTAGAESNCNQAGYNCEPVSGLCRTSCQTSDMCAANFTCDTAAQQCVRTG
jgi:hypothetical protein